MTDSRTQPRRRGFIAIMLVLTLMVISILGGVLLKIVILRRSELKTAERRLQAESLAESGLSRAISQLSSSPDYTGETWEIPLGEFAGRGDASVLIKVEPVTGKPDTRRIFVRADYPKAEIRRARETRELTIDVLKTKPTSTIDSKGNQLK